MNRIALGIVLAALLCFLGGPFATGFIAEDHLRGRIEQMGAANAWLNADVTSYERGWFSSRAVVDLALALDADQLPFAEPMLEALTGAVPVVVELRHGPVSISDGLGIAFVTARPDDSDAAIGELSATLNVPYLFEFRGRSGFTGRFEFDADVPPFSYGAMLGELRFSGLAVEGNAQGTRLHVSGAFDELGLQGALAAGAISGVSIDLEYEFRADQLPLGTATLGIARAVASSPMLGNEPLFELDNFSLTQSIALDARGDALDASALYAADRLAAGDYVDFSDVALGIRLAGIDGQAAADYYAIVDSAIEAPEFEPDALADRLSPVVDAVVRRGFRIDVEPARFATRDGTLNADIAITVDGSSLDPSVPADPRDLAVLFGVLEAEADLNVAKPLARELAARAMRRQIALSGEPLTEDELDAAADAQAGLTLATLAGQGLIADDGAGYSVKMTFADGQLLVNGNSIGPGFF